MKHITLKRTDALGKKSRIDFQSGFSALEVLVCVCILIPIMAAAMQFFSVGVNQHASEQSSIEANQDATAGFDLMTTEIAQAGSRMHVVTHTSSPIGASPLMSQTIPVDSSVGFSVGDTVEVDLEKVRITAVGNNTLTGVFKDNHINDTTVRMYSLPYKDGVLPPAGLQPNSATPVTTLRFFGDIYGDGNMYYVIYSYDAQNAQITRSMTNFTDLNSQPAFPLITNIVPGSARFILNTDHLNVITSVTVSLTVENEWELGSKKEQITLTANVGIPSAEAASELYLENLHYGPVNNLPSIPTRVGMFSEVPLQ